MASFTLSGVRFERRDNPPVDQFLQVIASALVGGVLMDILVGQDDQEYAYAGPQRGRREALWMDVSGYAESLSHGHEELFENLKDNGWEIGGEWDGSSL
ncbi:hypothetical protein [Cerasicoccus arenae]|uniref:Uncharacterized protein n=1 Tax=Cerasicoccus arenae TaxID=424488 RepID=A0A8J3DF51_9BACT|nr:hypothetical protein [Cerasicoccus arenae]MBK1860024.1 hypothetical protein [Cerasicoccus arenae]GHC12573.1 hypothetical protein GCM10007047_32420 [Cerasicoccus arenae]